MQGLVGSRVRLHTNCLFAACWLMPAVLNVVFSFNHLHMGPLPKPFHARRPHHICRMGHFEAPPYTSSSMRSAYHVRQLDVHRLMQVTQNMSDQTHVMVTKRSGDPTCVTVHHHM